MFQEQIQQFFYDFIAEGWRILTEDIVNKMVNTLPDLMGYITIACGGYIIIAPMLNKSVTRPLGLFTCAGMMTVSILGAT